MIEEREPDLYVSYVRKVTTGQYESAELRAIAKSDIQNEDRKGTLALLADEVIDIVNKKLEKATGQQIKSQSQEIHANFLNFSKSGNDTVAEGGLEKIIRKVEMNNGEI